MKNREELYQKLKKTYTDEELADSFLFSLEPSKKEAKAIRSEFLALRLAAKNAMTESERIASDLFAFKLRLRRYFEVNEYNP
ncbi:MAG: hypothetical protein AAGI23_22885, partial [Bacteroidota bacterium]